MSGPVKEGGTHTSFCYRKRKKNPNDFDARCWCAKGRTPPAASAPDTPPATGTDNRSALIQEIIASGKTKPNTAPATAGQGPAPAPVPGQPAAPGQVHMFVPAGIFRFTARRLNKLFKTEDFTLEKEDSEDLAECAAAWANSKGKQIDPFFAFAIMMLGWLGLPLLEHLPKLIAQLSGKKKKDGEGTEDGAEPAPDSDGGAFGFKLRRPRKPEAGAGPGIGAVKPGTAG